MFVSNYMPRGIYKRTKKIRKQISDKMKGRKLSEEHKKKISESEKGRIIPIEVRKKMSDFRLNKMKELGYINSPETRKKMSEASKERKREPFSVESKMKMRKSRIRYMTSGGVKNKDTSIEIKVENELKKRNIGYQKQIPLCDITIVDFYLPKQNIVIYCDGDYWHSRPKTIIRDKKQNQVLTHNGFNIFRFSEKMINESVEKCINKINVRI